MTCRARSPGWGSCAPSCVGLADRRDAVADPVYLNDGGPRRDLPPWVLSGRAPEVAERLRPLVDMGVNHLQVRLMARDAEELCDQVARFAVEVGPLLNR